MRDLQIKYKNYIKKKEMKFTKNLMFIYEIKK